MKSAKERLFKIPRRRLVICGLLAVIVGTCGIVWLKRQSKMQSRDYVVQINGNEVTTSVDVSDAPDDVRDGKALAALIQDYPAKTKYIVRCRIKRSNKGIYKYNLVYDAPARELMCVNPPYHLHDREPEIITGTCERVGRDDILGAMNEVRKTSKYTTASKGGSIWYRLGERGLGTTWSSLATS